jgi:hypothetical protein
MRGQLFFPLMSAIAMPLECTERYERTDGAAAPNPVSEQVAPIPSDSTGNDEVTNNREEPPIPSEVQALRPGVYRLTLRAEHGSCQGAASEGSLTLLPASVVDKSPTTGEIAKDVFDPPLFYGWTKLDFQRVAAPVGRNPDPASRDPVRPGVVVPASMLLKHQVVLIGTVASLRDGFDHLDGGGIALHVQSWSGNCHRGSWGRWGIAANGSGSFSACLVPNSISP